MTDPKSTQNESTEWKPSDEAVEAAIRTYVGDMGDETEEAVAAWMTYGELRERMSNAVAAAWCVDQ